MIRSGKSDADDANDKRLKDSHLTNERGQSESYTDRIEDEKRLDPPVGSDEPTIELSENEIVSRNKQEAASAPSIKFRPRTDSDTESTAFDSDTEHQPIVRMRSAWATDSTTGGNDSDQTEDDDESIDTKDKVRIANADECEADPTHALLHKRLRAVSFLLGFGLLTLWVAFEISTLVEGRVFAGIDGTSLRGTVILHVATSFGLIACGVALTLMKRSVCWQLHLIELAVFGMPSVLFAVFEYRYTIEYASIHNVLPAQAVGWILLMFTYALFIPNSWQRATLFVALFAFIPAALVTYLTYFHQDCCDAANANASYVLQNISLLLVGAVTSAVGVGMIGGLRREASQAKELGQYVLHEKIGEGGMGEVYLGEHRLMKRPCAIKLIRPERAGDRRILARFEREVRLTAQLSHWNNVDVYDFGRADDGTFFYAMEYLPGLTLKELVERYGPLSPGRVIHLLTQVCSALEEAHRHRLIHRDIKPSNIIAAERGGIYDVAKLVDFGLAKPLIESNPVNVTQDQVITGSPRYMSPEQATGESQPDSRSDIYSLGCVAYFLLTSRPPFDEHQIIRAIMAHATKEPVAPSTVNEQVPADLERVILKCLAKDPSERYRSAVDLREALAACVDDGKWGDADARQWWEARLDDFEGNISAAAQLTAN